MTLGTSSIIPDLKPESRVRCGRPKWQGCLLYGLITASILLSLGPLVGQAHAQTTAQLFAPIRDNKLTDATPQQSNQLEQLRRLPTTQSVYLVRVSPGVLRADQIVAAAVSGERTFNLQKTGGDVRSDQDFTSFGKIEADERGSWTMVVRDGNITGSISGRDGLYRITPVGGGVHAVVKVDTSKFPPEEPPSFQTKEKELTQTPGARDVGRQADVLTEIDALVAYTPAAKSAVADIGSLINLAVAEANQSYTNSAIKIHLKLVDSFQVNYTETGKTYDQIMTDFVGMTDVNQHRNNSNADVSVLIINQSDYCGLADAIKATASTAFALVYYDCATGYYSFAHEIGHLQGARHNPEMDPSTSPFPYGHGYQYNSQWRTIMAYNCTSNCTRLQYWSNPNISYGGVPMGTAATHNNARVLNETAATVAAFRTGPQVQITLSPSPIPPQPGTRLKMNDSVNFTATVQSNGAVLPGVVVTFKVGNPNLAGVTPLSVTTDASGVAKAKITGKTRVQTSTTLTAEAAGASSPPVTVNLPDVSLLGWILFAVILLLFWWIREHRFLARKQ